MRQEFDSYRLLKWESWGEDDKHPWVEVIPITERRGREHCQAVARNLGLTRYRIQRLGWVDSDFVMEEGE